MRITLSGFDLFCRRYRLGGEIVLSQAGRLLLAHLTNTTGTFWIATLRSEAVPAGIRALTAVAIMLHWTFMTSSISREPALAVMLELLFLVNELGNSRSCRLTA